MQLNTYKEERELDARIAEKVLKKQVTWEGNTPYEVIKEHSSLQETDIIPHYSTSLGSAMQVALELRRLNFTVDILMDKEGMSVTVWNEEGEVIVKHEHIISKFSAYMCHASLVAVGEESWYGDDDRRGQKKSIIR